MLSRVRTVTALAFALALGAAAAGALPPNAHRAQRAAPPATSFLATARGWLVAWLGGDPGRSTVRARDTSQIDPNGLASTVVKAVQPVPPKVCDIL